MGLRISLSPPLAVGPCALFQLNSVHLSFYSYTPISIFTYLIYFVSFNLFILLSLFQKFPINSGWICWLLFKFPYFLFFVFIFYLFFIYFNIYFNNYFNYYIQLCLINLVCLLVLNFLSSHLICDPILWTHVDTWI